MVGRIGNRRRSEEEEGKGEDEEGGCRGGGEVGCVCGVLYLVPGERVGRGGLGSLDLAPQRFESWVPKPPLPTYLPNEKTPGPLNPVPYIQFSRSSLVSRTPPFSAIF